MKVLEAPLSFDRKLVLELMRLADDSESEIQGYLSKGRLFLLRVEDTRQFAVGQILVLSRGVGSVEIKSLSIAPEHRRIGRGSFLLKEVLAILRREQIVEVQVSTSTADLDAIRFYQRNGFRFFKVERDVFTTRNGYPENLETDGIPVRDRIWLDIQL